MKNTPARITNIFESGDDFDTFVLVDLGFTPPIRLTSLPHNVTVAGELYLSDGGLTDYSPPQLTTVLDREVYRITLLDHSDEFRALFDAGAIGIPITVRLGIDAATDPFDGTGLDIVYRGRIDGAQINADFQGEQKAIVIEGSSPFADLDLVNDRQTSREEQRNIATAAGLTDTSMDEVYSASKEVTIGWGKK